MKRILYSVRIPIRFIMLLWLIKFVELHTMLNMAPLGIIPRDPTQIYGIFFAPLIHGHIAHLISNTIPLLFLGLVLYFFYDWVARTVFAYCYFLPGVLVWLFARPSLHIGASGLVYGIAFFLMFIGIFRKKPMSILISIATVVMYGGIIYGVLPANNNVSWEYHLGGALTGIMCAFMLGSQKKLSGFE